MDKIVADAGYESEENYVYLEKKGLRAFIKPSNYEQAKTRKYQKQLQERESYEYLEEQDCYVHPNGKRFVRVADRVSKKKSGLNYHRFPCKGLAGIKAEITFLALGLNLNTLLSKIRKGDFSPTKYKKNHIA